MLPNYRYKTNFSCAEFLVDINSHFIITARLTCSETEFSYKFALDTQFLSDKQITYEELVMIKNIIDILEENSQFVLSRLKKYTVEEYKEELRIREEQSKIMFENLKNMLKNRIEQIMY